MKRMQRAAVVATALAAMALVGAGSASATTLELSGHTVNTEVIISASLKSGTSAVLEDTSSLVENTCNKSSVEGHTTVFTGTAVTGPVDALSWTECERTVTVHKKGQLEVTLTGSTNGTIYSENAEVTSGTPFGHVNCKTVTTHLGTLTGVASEHATVVINANLTCTGISMRWTAEYTVTSPTGLGVSK